MTESRFAKIDKKLSTRKIVTIDFERRAGLTHIFDQRTHGFISATRWIRLPSTLCFAAQWYGGKMEFHAAWDDYDAMIQRAWEIYDEADAVITYNGKRADNRWIRDDWLVAGMAPPRPWKDIDLYQVNKSLFGFDSASLDHLCRRLGLQTKSGHYDPNRADACMDGDEKAQRIMTRYCKGDVRITEQAYQALLPWISQHPVVKPTAGDAMYCDRCGSDDLTATPGDYTAEVLTFALYRCGNCRGLVRARHHKGRIGRVKSVKS